MGITTGLRSRIREGLIPIARRLIPDTKEYQASRFFVNSFARFSHQEMDELHHKQNPNDRGKTSNHCSPNAKFSA